MTTNLPSSPQQPIIYLGEDGHVHFTDPAREAFANSVNAFVDRWTSEGGELSEGWEAADLAIPSPLGAESVDSLNRFGE